MTTNSGGRVPSHESITRVEHLSPSSKGDFGPSLHHEGLKWLNDHGLCELHRFLVTVMFMGLVATSVLTAETHAAAAHRRVFLQMLAQGVARWSISLSFRTTDSDELQVKRATWVLIVA